MERGRDVCSHVPYLTTPVEKKKYLAREALPRGTLIGSIFILSYLFSF